MPNSNKRGVILFIVLGTIISVMWISVVVLRIIEIQGRATHHHVSRIQAEYAAKAAIIYAFEQLRKNTDPNWTGTGPFTVYMRKDTGEILEGALPLSVTEVRVDVGDFDTGPVHTRKIRATAIYTYSLS